MDFVRGAAERFYGKEWFVCSKLEYLESRIRLGYAARGQRTYQTPKALISMFWFHECCWSNSGAPRDTGVKGRKLSCVFHLATTGVNNILLSC